MLKAQIFPVTSFAQNCSIIWCDETMEGALVDPGGDPEKLMAQVEKLGIKLTKMLLTHGHLDHAGGAADIKAKLGLPIIGPHKEDKFWLDQIEDNAAQYNMTGLKCCEPDQWLNDGDSVDVGNVKLEVYHTPGHTPGHVILFDRTHRVAFVGDVLFKGSVGRTDFPRGDTQTLLNAIQQKLWPLGDDVTFVPGHGPLSTFGAERKTNPFVADHVLAAQ